MITDAVSSHNLYSRLKKRLACLNTDSNNYSIFNRGQVESPSHDTIEFFDNCIAESNIDDLDVTDIVLVATSVWYERTGRDDTMRKIYNIIYRRQYIYNVSFTKLEKCHGSLW